MFPTRFILNASYILYVHTYEICAYILSVIEASDAKIMQVLYSINKLYEFLSVDNARLIARFEIIRINE